MSEPEIPIKPNYKKDIKSILLLFCLYILQGVPLGLIVTVPFLLQSRGVSYAEQGKFSLAHWPFSLKILYAPIIDAVYFQRLGRRKSWLIPLQYMIAIFMLVLAFQVEDLLNTGNVTALAAMFFILNFLAASQDVVVDGWALTMLRPENVGYASTCNVVGQILGITMGYSGFLLLDSAKFANNFRSVPVDTGIITFSQFLFFWAAIFTLMTTLILIFKSEAKECSQVNEAHMDVIGSYKNLWKILKLRNIRILAVICLTARIGIAATEGLSKLKLVATGVPKETIAFFSIPLIPVKLLLPLCISKWTAGSNPMRLFALTIPLSLCFGIIYPVVVFFSPGFKSVDTDTGLSSYGMGYNVFLFGVFALDLMPGYTRFVASMAFTAKISDPIIGGTYMTLINTMSNIGVIWPTTLALWLVDYVAIPISNNDCIQSDLIVQSRNATPSTYYEVENSRFQNTTVGVILSGIDKGNASISNQKSIAGQHETITTNCLHQIDGYYVESAFCVIFGFLWLFWGYPTMIGLQRKPKSSWRVFKDACT